ncbi:tetraacyldisaccharide 4'-kinase [Nitrincola sp. MINF-07-Sa-05]|uniref:tetraacyldisaccharide 4'-kinase n=1 Tax=Nitrincola salilacus TaxID=3400273 RepID=UPI003918189D
MRLLERSWYEPASWSPLLRPLSWLFEHLATRRRYRYLSNPEKQWKAPVPVVVVGNISVGGTGKTPLVIALIALYRSQGFKPGVVSRGYGGKAPYYPFHVTENSSPAESGDEPLLIVRQTAVPLVVDPDRVAAAKSLLAQTDCDIIISDDGLQHYRLGRDIEIAVIDGQRGLGNQRCLPEGPLREPVSRLQQVDMVVVNNGQQQRWPDDFMMDIVPTSLRHLRSGVISSIESWRAGQECRVHAVAGIGNPARFFDTLKGIGLKPVEHPFPDHHQYRPQDIEFNDALPVIMTEKDAVKFQTQLPDDCWALQVEAGLSRAFEEQLIQLTQRVNLQNRTR